MCKFGLKLSSAITAIAIGMTSTSLMAQTAPAESADEASAAQGDVIIVTATRRAEGVQKVPISMTVLGEDAVDSIASPGELAKLAPNIQIDQTSGISFQRVGIRGIAQNDFNANATTSNMVYLDEVPFNSPISQGVAFWDLERVEILRGPQGTQFGRNATGGAIRYITSKPGDVWGGEVSATLGRFNQREFRGAIGGPLGDSAGIRLSMISNVDDGWAFNEIRQQREGRTDYYGIRGILVLEPTDTISATLQAQYFKGGVDPVMVKSTPGLATQDGILPAADLAALQASYGMTGIAPASDFSRIENDFVGLEEVEHLPISLDINIDLGFADLTSTTGYVKVNQRFGLDDDGSPAPILNEYDFHRARQWTQEIRLTSNDDGPFQWILGGFYFDEDVDATLNFHSTEFLIGFFGFNIPGGGIYTRGSETKTESYAGFVDATYQISSDLKANAGVRYTHESKDITYIFRDRYVFPTDVPRTSEEVFDFVSAINSGNLGTLLTTSGPPLSGGESWNNVSFRVGLDYQLTPDTLLYGLISRGFKGGSFQPNANLPSQVLDANGNLISVKPETVTNFEVGVKSDIVPRRLRVNASAYYYDYRDYQTNQFIAAIAGQQLSSLPKARLLGAEVEFRAEPVDNLVFQGGVGITDTKIVESLDPSIEGNDLPLAERFNFNGAVSYRIETGVGEFVPQVSMKYRGRYFTNKENDTPLGKYTTLDLQLAYQSNGPVFASLWARNITDVREPILVDDTFEFFGGNFAYISPPKTYGITVGARF